MSVIGQIRSQASQQIGTDVGTVNSLLGGLNLPILSNATNGGRCVTNQP